MSIAKYYLSSTSHECYTLITENFQQFETRTSILGRLVFQSDSKIKLNMANNWGPIAYAVNTLTTEKEKQWWLKYKYNIRKKYESRLSPFNQSWMLLQDLLPSYNYSYFQLYDWLPIASHIQFKILLLVSKSQLGLAPRYLTDVLCKPISSTSAHLFGSTNRLDLFVPRVRTALAQCRAFAVSVSSS